MKKFLFSLLFISVTLFGCASNTKLSEQNSASVEIEVQKTIEKEQFAPAKENVKFLGRTYSNNNLLWLGYTNTGVEFNVSANYLEVTIRGDTSANGKDNGNNARIVAFLDGERIFDQLILEPFETYEIFNKDEAVNGVVRIIKVSECSSSVAAIKSIGINKGGKISPTSDKNLKIEFIGDSITCGYGVDDLNRNNHFATRTEDGSKAFAYKTAQLLDADYSMVSVSGSGIVSCYSGDGNRNTWALHPSFYEKLGFGSYNIGGKSIQSINWDFSNFTPDLIVINLGTNDASYTKNNSTKIDEYKTEYVKFLKQVRTKNPDAKIICALGIMGQDLCPAVEDAVKTYREETGDLKVTSLKFNNQSNADGICADWHPSEKTHQKAAALLVSHIHSLTE